MAKDKDTLLQELTQRLQKLEAENANLMKIIEMLITADKAGVLAAGSIATNQAHDVRKYFDEMTTIHEYILSQIDVKKSELEAES